MNKGFVAVNSLSMADMVEATRLTGEGKLAEATALLLGTRARTNASTPEGKTILDMVPPAAGTGGSWTAPDTNTPPSGRDQEGWPEGARVEDRLFSNAAGELAYKLYVPSGYKGEPVPLVVMLHGCTQSPDDFAAGTRMNVLAEEQVFLVAYPAQPASANPSKCWNWFRPDDQARDRGEPSLIAGATRQIAQDFAVDRSRIYAAGLSAGGAAAAILGTMYPDLYAAVGIHSGLACGAASDLPSAMMAMHQGSRLGGAAPGVATPTIVFHGDRDATVNPLNGEQIIAGAAGHAGLKLVTAHGTSAGGVAYTRHVYEDRTGRPMLEHWLLRDAGHAWSGGSPDGSYTDPSGPDASREMLRFFAAHAL